MRRLSTITHRRTRVKVRGLLTPSPVGVAIEKFTNGVDADTPPGPNIAVGDPVLWTYEVTNIGNFIVTGLTVTDSQGVVVTCPQDFLAEAVEHQGADAADKGYDDTEMNCSDRSKIRRPRTRTVEPADSPSCRRHGEEGQCRHRGIQQRKGGNRAR